MVAITATNSATPSLQAALGRAKLQQARQEADRAESNAQNLRQQANAAEQEARTSQTRVRAIAGQIDKNGVKNDASPRLNDSADVSTKNQNLVVNRFDLYSATSDKRAPIGNGVQPDAAKEPVINTQGQATGRIINIRA